VDVKLSSQQLNQMLKLSGGRREVPVIVQDGSVTIGFGGT
jgi:glutaredoxin 3